MNHIDLAQILQSPLVARFAPASVWGAFGKALLDQQFLAPVRTKFLFALNRLAIERS